MMKMKLLMFCSAIAMLFATVGCGGPKYHLAPGEQFEGQKTLEAEREAAQHVATENTNPVPLDSSDNTPNDAN